MVRWKQYSHIILLTFMLIFLVIIAISSNTTSEILIVSPNGIDHYKEIQTAIDSSSDGDIIRIYNGTYHETLTIDRSIIIKGNSTSTTVISSHNQTVINITSSNVSITGISILGNSSKDNVGLYASNVTDIYFDNINISSSYYGLKFYNTSKVIFSNSYIYQNWWGVIIYNSSRVNFTNLTAINEYLGFGLTNTKNVSIDYVTANNHQRGFVLFRTQNVTLHSSNLSNNERGLAAYLSQNINLINNSFINNDESGMAIYQSEFFHISNINANYNNWSGISFIETTNSSIANSILRNNRAGIDLLTSSNIMISNNKILDNIIGIKLRKVSRDNIIHFNSIIGNDDYGISGEENIIKDTLSKNNWWGDSTGPFNTKQNPNGNGDIVTEDIIFSPWLYYHPKIHLPDLIISTNLYDEMEIIPVISANEVDLIVIIKNQGHGPSINSTLSININNESWLNLGVPQIDANKEFEIEMKFTLDSLGDNQILLIIDKENIIIESNELNNNATLILHSIPRVSSTPSFNFKIVNIVCSMTIYLVCNFYVKKRKVC